MLRPLSYQVRCVITILAEVRNHHEGVSSSDHGGDLLVLLGAPFPAFAQTNDSAPAAPADSPTNAPTAPADGQTTAPSGNPTAPTLEDLGLSPQQAQGSAQDQARLDKRSHMLKIHQRLGLIDTIPLIATVATSFGAGGRSTSNDWRWTHLALGSATGTCISPAPTTPSSPRNSRDPCRGPIRLHKALAWIHGPGMILTPILGAMAFDEKSKGERVHGIASAHVPVALVTAGAYGAAILSLTFKW